MLNFWADTLLWPHAICQQIIPKNTFYTPLYAALVCGNRVEDAALKEMFSTLGIVHLLVVSGAHLAAAQTLLQFSLQKLRPPWKIGITFVALLIYCGFCAWNLPVVRAFLQWCFGQISQHRKWHWTGQQLCLLSGLITSPLLFIGHHPLGLALSWTAAVALKIPGKNKVILRSISIYLLLFPLLLPLVAPHPLSLIVNLTLAPLLAITALPISAAACISPWTQQLGDSYWKSVLGVLTPLQQIFPEGLQSPLVWTSAGLFTYVFVLQWGALFYEKR